MLQFLQGEIMIDICKKEYLSQIESFVSTTAPYQQVLVLYDFTAPSMLIDEINKALFQKCILTKYLSKDHSDDSALTQLIAESQFRACIIISQHYCHFPIENILYIPTAFDVLTIVDDNVNTLVCPDIISANISNSNNTICKTLAHIQNFLYEQLFCYSIDNNKTITFEISQLINLINNYYLISTNFDIENIIINYYEIICKINNFLLKINKNIVKIDINDYFLKDFIFIQQIYYYIFVLIKNNSTQIFDVYKCAKKNVIFSKKYFDFINYFYSLCADQNIQYCIYHYCNHFSLALQSSLRALNIAQDNLFMQNQDNSLHFSLAQTLLQKDIDTNNKTLLGYAKLLNII